MRNSTRRPVASVVIYVGIDPLVGLQNLIGVAEQQAARAALRPAAEFVIGGELLEIPPERMFASGPLGNPQVCPIGSRFEILQTNPQLHRDNASCRPLFRLYHSAPTRQSKANRTHLQSQLLSTRSGLVSRSAD